SRGVQQDGQRRNVFGFHVTIHQKALAIFGDVISKNVGAGNRRAAADLEQKRGRPGRENTFTVDRHCHQHSVGCDVEDFLSVSAPPWLGAPAAGHLPFPRRARERGDVNLPVAGLIGGIRHPFTIGRNLSFVSLPWLVRNRVGSPPATGSNIRYSPDEAWRVHRICWSSKGQELGIMSSIEDVGMVYLLRSRSSPVAGFK